MEHYEELKKLLIEADKEALPPSLQSEITLNPGKSREDVVEIWMQDLLQVEVDTYLGKMKRGGYNE